MKSSSLQHYSSTNAAAKYRSRKRLSFWLILIALFLAACSQTPPSIPETEIIAPLYGMDNPERVEGSYIVVMKDGNQEQTGLSAASLNALTTLEGLSLTAQYAIGDFQGFAAQMTDTALESIRQNPNVAYVEADAIATGDQVQAWGLDRIDQHDLPLDSRFKGAKRGKGVNVYVIDSGIRRTHQEFGGRVAQGNSFVADNRGTNDCNGHGTHVAATIGGNTVGVATEVTIVPVRVLDCSNKGLNSWVVAGINWVSLFAQRPAVANVSIGSVSQATDDAVRAAIRKGITFVVSAGNDNTDACNISPARVREAITVGATDQADARASFSNWGGCVDLFAPGVGIRSASHTGDTEFALKDGTSMAAPHVTGVVAAMITPDAKYTLNQNTLETPSSNEQRILACSTQGKVTNSQTGNNHLLHFCYDYIYRMGDVNGDNAQDIVRFGERSVDVALSNKFAGGIQPFKVWYTSEFTYQTGWRTYRHERELADVNGDGKADIVGFGETGVRVATSTGSSFLYGGARWSDVFGYNAGGWRVGTHVRKVVDVNGDKKADIIGFGNGGVHVALSTGNNFTYSGIWVADFTYDTMGWLESKHVREVGDINGDGRADIVGFGDDGVHVALSTGSSFVHGGRWSGSFAFNDSAGSWRVDKHPRKVADVNGDGKADIIGFGSAVLVSFSTGTGFSTPAIWHYDFDLDSGWSVVSGSSPFTKVSLAYDPAHPRFVADISGNGKADIVAFGNTSKPFKDIAFAVATSINFGNKVLLSQE
jgi:subtilisin family serine protease